MEASNPAAGWYPAPNRDGMMRWWNGSMWADRYRPSLIEERPYVPVAQTEQRGQGLILPGFICAVLIPIVGIILGVILLAKERIGPGLGVLAASGTCWVLWTSWLLSSGSY